jgi:hypothetical protein
MREEKTNINREIELQKALYKFHLEPMTND